MGSFTMIKGELSQISEEKNRIEENQELLQLEQLRATLGETIDESEKLGEDDLLQLDQTVGSGLSATTQTNEEEPANVLADTENIQLSSEDDLEQLVNSYDTRPVTGESNLLELSEEVLRAEQSNHVIQGRIRRLLE